MLTMEKDTSKKPTSLLADALQQKKENKEEEVVIPDECGDTLWDKVLEQEEKKDASENKE